MPSQDLEDLLSMGSETITYWDSMIGADIANFLKGLKTSQIKLLDVGCGAGKWDRLSSRILSPSKDLIMGLDLSKHSLSTAKKANSKSRITEYVFADASRIPFASGSFNAVLVICLLHHLSNDCALREVLNELKRLTTGSNLVLFVENTVDNPFKNFLVNTWKRHKSAELHLHGFSSPELIEMLRQNGFQLVDRSYENLFLVYALTVLGFFRITMPNWLIFRLHRLENLLIRSGFWKYCGTVHLTVKTPVKESV